MPETNKHFARWTKRTAFSLTLTEAAISNLLSILDWEDKLCDPEETCNGLIPGRCCDPDEYGFALWGRNEAAYLERRGLIRLANKAKNAPCNYVLTEPGIHTARLLACAGFKNHYHHTNCHW